MGDEVSLFPAYDPNGSYRGAFYPAGGTELAYRTVHVNNAINGDHWEQLKETIALGWLAPECRAFDNSYIIDYCLAKGARACALELRALGWPEWARRTA